MRKALFAEAKALWQTERSMDSVLTAAAAQILSNACSGGGADVLSLQLRKQGQQMAERLGLIGVPGDEATETAFGRMSPKAKMNSAHAAWGIHNVLM